MIVKDEVKHIAQLAELKLTAQELTKFQKEISSILDFVSELGRVSLKIETKKDIFTKKNKVKPDIARPSLSIEEVLKNVSEAKNNFIKIKKLFEWI